MLNTYNDVSMPWRYLREAKMLKDDDILNSSIDERAQVILGVGGDRAMLLPR